MSKPINYLIYIERCRFLVHFTDVIELDTIHVREYVLSHFLVLFIYLALEEYINAEFQIPNTVVRYVE